MGRVHLTKLPHVLFELEVSFVPQNVASITTLEIVDISQHDEKSTRSDN